MPQQDLQPFDDPALKAALRRCFAQESAPGSLRARIQALAGAASSAAVEMKPASADRSFWSRRWFPVAAAATVLLGIGAYILVRQKAAGTGGSLANDVVLVDMAQRHDSCCALPNHNYIHTALNDFPAAGRLMAAQLNHPVLSADLVKEGWHFRGAAICPVGSTRSAHLVFDFPGTGKTLSCFSVKLPTAAHDGESITTSVKGHALAGFVRGDTCYCMVEFDSDGPTDAADLQKLLLRHENELSDRPALAAAQGEQLLYVMHVPH